MPSPKTPERSVTRTYRAAIRIGEDFITLEETITLPPGASDEEIQQAVELGWHIYQAQQAAIETQIAAVRESHAGANPVVIRDPEAPASEKQRSYIAALQEDMAWSSEQMTAYAEDHAIDLVTMTKGQASTFIDSLKRLAEERTHYSDKSRPRAQPTSTTSAMPTEPGTMTDRQRNALHKLAQERHANLETEVQQQLGISLEELSSEQAGALLAEWQRIARDKPSRRSPESDTAS